MTRILRLLLIAAIALPYWQPIAAQEVKPTLTTPPKVFDSRGKAKIEGKQTVGEKTVITTGSTATVTSNHQVPSLKDFTSETITRNAKYTVAEGRLIQVPYAPVYGEYYYRYVRSGTQYVDLNQYYQNYRTRSQMIYTEDMLKPIEHGSLIKSLTFYANSDGIKFGNEAGTSGQLTITIGNCSQSAFTSDALISFSGSSVSGTVTPKKGSKEFSVTFSSPFTYNGGNLLVDVAVTRSGTADSEDDPTYFSGIHTANKQSIVRFFYNSYYGNQFYQVDFLPKMTIGYSYECETPVSGDKAFFQGKSYTWGNGMSSDLSQIATDPDQIIALLRKVYSDPTIPGNYKRGYDENGVLVGSNLLPFDVPYTAAGTLVPDGNAVKFDDTYGWNILCDQIYGESNSSPFTDLDYDLQYWYMNPVQYKPENDGVTLILLELQDNFTPTNVYVKDENGNNTEEILLPATTFTTGLTGYAQLKEYISKTIKSARIITESKRTGNQSDFTSGTLFKINCDQMNKFYLVAKGQLQWHASMLQATDVTGYNFMDFYSEPNYLKGYFTDPETSETTNFNEYLDPGLKDFYFLLGHMFEQFSPAMSQTGDEVTGARSDIYQDLINMESFGVIHDCPNVPLVGDGHHFMMYGPDSKSDDCQDVRDMMFFVPDYRMMNHEERGTYRWTYSTGGGIMGQEYFKYNPDHQPTMGMFVIKQYPITGNQVEGQDTYRLHLTWTSNLLKFLPSEQGKYNLYRVITNPDGTKTYTQVGDDFDPNTFEYYDDVPMQQTGQQVTYVVQGQDISEFLDLQFSNEESFIIPGLDRAEQLRLTLSNDYYYSRFFPETGKNYYSNSLVIDNNIGTNVKAKYLKDGTKFMFMRVPNGNTADEVQFAVATVQNMSDGTGTLVITPDETRPDYWQASEYRYGRQECPATATFTYDPNNSYSDIVFQNMRLYDNFSVLADNNHPGSYSYYVKLVTEEPFALSDQTSNIPAIATVQEGKTYAYFEAQYEDWYEVRAYAWNGDVEFAGPWAGADMTYIGTINNKKVYRWSIDKDPNGAMPSSIIFSYKDGYHNFTQTGDLEFTNGGYYTPSGLVGTSNTSNEARSNMITIPVYKTSMAMKPLSTEQVDNDIDHSAPIAVKFDINVQHSSKQEIYRYDAYRWADSDENVRTIIDLSSPVDNEQDIAPNGEADNQVYEYTTKINGVTGETYPISQGQRRTVQFVDEFLKDATSADTYSYYPVVEVFAPAAAVDNNNVDRTDYNTYGAPKDIAACGVVEVKVPEGAELVGGFTWKKGDDRYAYYNVDLRVNKDEIPEGYEVYRVRAWRQVDPTLLDEPLEQFANRKTDTGEYMFENMLGVQETDGEYQQGANMILGSKVIDDVVNPNNGTPITVYRGTFGARKVQTTGANAQNDGCVNKLDMNFIVRVYFTPKRVEEEQGGQQAPRLKAEGDTDDRPFYIAEYVYPFTINGGIPTGIETLNARQVVSEKYYNPAGIESSTPFQGVNIVVTRYSDGSTTTTKILR